MSAVRNLFRYCLYENVEIRLSSIRLWRFVQNCNCFGVQLSISSPLNEPSVTFHYDGLDTGVAFGFASTQSGSVIADEYRGTDDLQACTPFFCGRSLGSRASGVATVDIVKSRFSCNGVADTIVLAPSRPCFFVAVGSHRLRPVWSYH